MDIPNQSNIAMWLKKYILNQNTDLTEKVITMPIRF